MLTDQRGIQVVYLECHMWQGLDEGMQRRTGLETHPLYSVGACREAGDIQAELLEVGLAGPGDVRGDAEMVIPPAPPGDDLGWFVALTEAEGCLWVVWG